MHIIVLRIQSLKLYHINDVRREKNVKAAVDVVSISIALSHVEIEVVLLCCFSVYYFILMIFICVFFQRLFVVPLFHHLHLSVTVLTFVPLPTCMIRLCLPFVCCVWSLFHLSCLILVV